MYISTELPRYIPNLRRRSWLYRIGFSDKRHPAAKMHLNIPRRKGPADPRSSRIYRAD
eukprot:SAG31_NODE_11480_length_1025_cov_2.760259_2_plen_57_part_01